MRRRLVEARIGARVGWQRVNANVLYEPAMIGSFRRARRGFSALLLVLLASGGCRKQAPPDVEAGAAIPKPKDLPALVVKAETSNLLLTWIDPQGDFHVVQNPGEVPMEARQAVRVVVADQTAGTGDRVYVADLGETAPDGSYRLKTMTRAAWDELGASRRQQRLEALAPSATPPPVGSNGPLVGQPDGRPTKSGVVVIVYGAEWCKPCHDAESYLRQRGIQVLKKDIETSEVAANEMRQKLERAGLRGASIPVIDVMGRILVGFSPGSLDRAVQAATEASPL